MITANRRCEQSLPLTLTRALLCLLLHQPRNRLTPDVASQREALALVDYGDALYAQTNCRRGWLGQGAEPALGHPQVDDERIQRLICWTGREAIRDNSWNCSASHAHCSTPMARNDLAKRHTDASGRWQLVVARRFSQLEFVCIPLPAAGIVRSKRP